MGEVLAFEIELAKASMSREARRNLSALYNPVLIGKYFAHIYLVFSQNVQLTYSETSQSEMRNY